MGNISWEDNAQLNIQYKKTQRIQSASNTDPHDIIRHSLDAVDGMPRMGVLCE